MPIAFRHEIRPLFVLLGLAVAGWHMPENALAAPPGPPGMPHASPHMMGKGGVCPRAFPDFAPESLPTPKPERANSRFESRLFAMPLPADLTPQQQQIALAAMRKAEPYLTVLHTQLRQTLMELHNLSFASDTPPDALPMLGRKLMQIRTDVLCELQRLSGEIEHNAGFNPGWGNKVRAFRMPDLAPQQLSETIN